MFAPLACIAPKLIRNLFDAVNILDWDVNADASGDNGSFDSYVGAGGRPGGIRCSRSAT